MSESEPLDVELVCGELLDSALCWEPEARILGNLRAMDLGNLCGAFAGQGGRIRGLERELAAFHSALAPFRALVAAYPHEVDGWLVTHTEPGLTLGDVRRLVGEGRWA